MWTRTAEGSKNMYFIIPQLKRSIHGPDRLMKAFEYHIPVLTGLAARRLSRKFTLAVVVAQPVRSEKGRRA
jgi:hypothetical protein